MIPTPIYAHDHSSSSFTEMLDAEVGLAFVDYMVDCVVETVFVAIFNRYFVTRDALKTAFFFNFAQKLILESGVNMQILLVALAYIDRTHESLKSSFGEEWACERVLLGAIIVASKYTFERSWKTEHWSPSTGLTKQDINRIEREFLAVLDYNVEITEAALLAHRPGLLSRCRSGQAYWLQSPFASRPPTPEPERVTVQPISDVLDPFDGSLSPISPDDSPSPFTPALHEIAPVALKYLSSAPTIPPIAYPRRAEPDTRSLPPLDDIVPVYLRYPSSPIPTPDHTHKSDLYANTFSPIEHTRATAPVGPTSAMAEDAIDYYARPELAYSVTQLTIWTVTPVEQQAIRTWL
ncbi:hypothetical protein WOLCODRAFT_163204 [Wolfiporia cocos MD-104 SS10]|uniref:Cyclin N-terminal domain-containing protein n=1 Tax=Wolfiporia cocos (strain MD-104) TaxID=742152 RepID=A0A2H3JXW6_WOLCO|nr:hypothetical protein WOLCODRAFT_163204 [Wolfiporia cocos MD-104 SS10]